MNAKDILIEYNKNDGWGISDEELIQTLWEAPNLVYEEPAYSSRWWENYLQILKLNDHYVGYHWARANRDESIFDLGWEFDWDTLQEYEPREIKKTIYVPKQ